ncbi:L-serine ammonia-lyase [Limimaricola sp. AA108-03]|uniref:L-serine ammonia-lyase n=1 Tax=Limimaricola sp. AA108-03 TaxID=3425945 RepID=UPI003D777AE6
MPVSVFEIFKPGIGPSSSHTMGPMVAAARFLNGLRGGAERIPGAGEVASVRVSLHGSLAFTGKGHASDRAVVLGLLGQRPETLDPDAAEGLIDGLRQTRTLHPEGLPSLGFDLDTDLLFDYGPALPLHANGMIFRAFDRAGNPFLTTTYYSVGGGFVQTEAELVAAREGPAQPGGEALPHPFRSAREMLAMGEAAGLSIAAMTRANESARGVRDLDARLDALSATMNACIDRGLSQEGILPGGLKVKRRAKAIQAALRAETGNRPAPHVANEWMSVYAMAVNEENAAGGRVVTAPTNGAAGTVPAVLRYWLDHCDGVTEARRRDFLLTAAAIGGIIKTNASISGAEVGCQGEVGSASAMAAAGLCAAMGGSNAQIENAAEIALEHHLGMTCDPAGGLVQVPCIERNALGAIKAVSAAALALRGNGTHFMPLDNCIKVMLETGRDMNTKYKETSTGGIAVNLPEC